MNILIKSARVIDPNSSHNGKKIDILIENGKIKSIIPLNPPLKRETFRISQRDKKLKTFTAPNLHVSPGWFDMHVNFRDPGYEYKEDLITGCRAAAFGGFTGVACMPATNPPIHTKSEVEYVKNKTEGSIVDVHPIGALSYQMQGKDLTEMFDMHNSGAVAFSDDKIPVSNSGLLLRALLYVNGFNGLIISHSEDNIISFDGMMNEGPTSTSLGLHGIPSLAEEIIVSRNIYLAEYTNSRIHLSTISTAKSVDLIRAAKTKGIKVTAEVAAHHLALDDSVLSGFDSNYKVNPPLRGKPDIKALKKGLADGTIDAICSDHSPEDEEMKKREFDNAAFGMIGMETAYALANTNLTGTLSLIQLVHKLAIRPREILNLSVPAIKEGEKANLTLFAPSKEWTFTEEDIRSKSKNTPFIGTKFKGKALGIYNNKQFVISD
ncbi:MAG: dihydroorotase [Bacteroidota bacterium]